MSLETKHPPSSVARLSTWRRALQDDLDTSTAAELLSRAPARAPEGDLSLLVSRIVAYLEHPDSRLVSSARLVARAAGAPRRVWETVVRGASLVWRGSIEDSADVLALEDLGASIVEWRRWRMEREAWSWVDVGLELEHEVVQLLDSMNAPVAVVIGCGMGRRLSSSSRLWSVVASRLKTLDKTSVPIGLVIARTIALYSPAELVAASRGAVESLWDFVGSDDMPPRHLAGLLHSRAEPVGIAFATVCDAPPHLSEMIARDNASPPNSPSPRSPRGAAVLGFARGLGDGRGRWPPFTRAISSAAALRALAFLKYPAQASPDNNTWRHVINGLLRAIAVQPEMMRDLLFDVIDALNNARAAPSSAAFVANCMAAGAADRELAIEASPMVSGPLLDSLPLITNAATSIESPAALRSAALSAASALLSAPRLRQITQNWSMYHFKRVVMAFRDPITAGDLASALDAALLCAESKTRARAVAEAVGQRSRGLRDAGDVPSGRMATLLLVRAVARAPQVEGAEACAVVVENMKEGGCDDPRVMEMARAVVLASDAARKPAVLAWYFRLAGRIRLHAKL